MSRTYSTVYTLYWGRDSQLSGACCLHNPLMEAIQYVPTLKHSTCLVRDRLE